MQALPHPLCVSLAHARSLFRPLLPSARYVGYSSGWGGDERLFEFDWEEEGWALIQGWALINFFGLEDGCLFGVGANSRLGAYSNKYGTSAVRRLQL